MRVQPWIVLILSVLLPATSQTGLAQTEGGSPYGRSPYGGYPPPQHAPGNPAAAGGYPGGAGHPAGGFFQGDGSFVPPPPGAPPGGWSPIAAGQNGGPGYHPDRLPWPQISPFENRFAEHTNEDGLWFFRNNNSARQYYGSADYFRANYRRPDQTRVGSELAPQAVPILTIGSGTPGGAAAAAAIPSFFLPVDTGVLYDSFLGNFNGLATPRAGTGGTQGVQNLNAPSVNNVAVNEQHRDSDPTVNGFQLNWGFRDPSDNGLEVSGWYTPGAHWAYSRGYNPTAAEILARTNFSDGRPLAVTNALPLDNGADGIIVPYDRFFGLDYESVGGGGDVNWNFTPFWRSDWYQFAPTVGLRFLYVGEQFAVNAANSGGAVVFQIPPGLEIPQTFVPVVQPFETQILSEVRSYLMGPQVGVRFQLGGENLKVRGHSEVGLAVNHEELELSGFGVGNGFDPVVFNQRNSFFREEQDHTRLSPMTSHEVTAEMKLFSFIPLIRKIHVLEEAKFRIGYQIVAAFELQRPHRTIQYNGLPLIPAIRNDQETRWYVDGYTFGVHWDY